MTIPAVTILCSSCKQDFVLNLTEEATEEGATQSFTCPFCNHVYPVARISQRGLEIREELKDLRLRAREDDLLMPEVECLQEALKREVSKLT